ncbi:hypothetical protein GCM10010317_077220 [Streptomyces mirabilis]|uniref:DUF6197 family protein n=1 Tax=Streptomyces mirabilis TaxID=68239 RepID=UPI00167D2E2E|nr:hypothetical protein [Streptomyces mirabilis]GHD70267.1 hypothetical protein GCM10010317_077220 [Streptomyces mirabilis]
MTITLAPATATPVELDLDARMALTLAEMDGRCRTAVIAVDINSAHIAVDTPEITAPLPLTPTLAPSPYSTPIAGLLHRARNRIITDGWCRDALHDEQGAICPIRAIRLEAASRHQADDACVLLLESIQRTFRTETIPSWNSTQTGPAPVLLAFDRAAELAHNRSL